MILLLLAYATMHCSDALVLQERVNADDNLAPNVKLELIGVIREATPECGWDAKAD